ncbi:CCA tRNA nucleotidyltransferase [Halobacteriales archaeon Cl-PHB]
MSDEFDAVCEAVRERVVPDDAERDHLEAVIDDLVDRTEAAVADLPVDADVRLVGSTARDTWLAGDRDVDLFVCFPPEISRADLEAYGLEVGHAVLPAGHEEYAEHPYVVGEYEGYQVDLVPCIAVESASDIRSAVDRTPFHTDYVEAHLGDLADDVRLAKQFLTGIGAYGSNLRTRGFSGFLVELLVMEYGGFRPLLEAAADWHPPVELDPEDHGQASFSDPLVVIDPTDPTRNVAAVCSSANVARLQHYARDLLTNPREDLFEPRDPEPLSADEIRDGFADRGTTPIALQFATPDVVEDQLYPQLDRSLAGISDELDRRGFDVLRADRFATDETSVLLVELAVAERPAVERHEGPPVHVGDHAANFFDAYEGTDAFGPFVDGDRYVVERERAVTTAEAFLESDALFDVALGTHVQSTLEVDYDVLVGAEAVAGLAADFGRDLAAYLSPMP